jgi:hypothetical protein
MANSKANIYPIQLQGAELNLNKYDAEIKQYSGFNKNNAPFVGGCLANVFTKDETQEGSTSENTYIDTNGDVYHVDTEGLWKNDIQLETKSVFNFELEKLPSIQNDDEVLFYFHKKVILTKDYKLNGVLVKFGKNEGFEDCFNQCCSVIFDTINNKNVCIFTSRCFSSNSSYQLLYIVIIDTDTGDVLFNNSFSISNVTYSNDYDFKMAVIHTAGASTFNVLYEGYYTSSSTRAVINTSCSIANDWTVTVNSSLLSNFLISSSVDTYKVFSSSVLDWHIMNFPANKAYIKKSTNISNCTRLYFALSLDESKINNGLTLQSQPTSNYISLSSSISVTDSDVNNNYLQKEFLSATMNQYLCSFVFQFYTSDSFLNVIPINCNKLFSLVSEGEVKRAKSLLGYKESSEYDTTILYNGNLISGLSKNGVLLTDWNVINSNYIGLIKKSVIYDYNRYYYDEICYSIGSSFYIIKNSSPKLKKVLSQIVTNGIGKSDIEYKNSYDTKLKELLFYAPDWNDNITTTFTDSKYTRFALTASNNAIVASAVNEYKRERNASIIINPINVRVNSDILIVENLESKYQVNIYEGSENECLYLKSYKKGSASSLAINYYIDTDLIDLQYPTNTEGNIEYSPCIFSELKSLFGNEALIKNGYTYYPLEKGNDSQPVISFFLASGIDNLQEAFIIQGQYYGIINNGLYSIQYSNGVLSDVAFVVDTTGLKFCGNTPYQAFFFSKTNRCLYSFTGANVMNQAQFLDKFEDVIGYKYNPATQTIFMITENEVIAYSSFGIYEIYFPNCKEIYLLENGACLTDDEGNFRYIKYYAENGYTKQNITLDTCFYGMNNQTVTINDCLYVRLFSEEHESGNVEMTASTLSNSGRMTEKTTFKIKSTDWDKMTHTVYLRYQPKEQRGLGVSFSINSPFKIAALSVGSQPDAILIDKVSKNAINAPQRTTNNNEW